ncbi:substrate-binding domain-containing protein [Rhizobium sp. TRM95796]|jgi:D-xylose transport system substrate-binding protein|uniref:substrate-binding domain-containing protein n=2 Tax=unclassified Rhizobium TaxID=2613769 RepID=UPI00247C6501|nr:D-xylose transport system substrate-binding protein [Rhizobium sp. SG_E_25_P2]
MKKFAVALASAVFAMSVAGPVMAAGKTVAVSWKIFQEERWKTDEAVIKKIVEDNGDKYISADAQGSAAKQLTDIESLMSQGADVLLIVPYDSEAIMPAVEKAASEGVPMIAYDVQIEHPSVLYMTFDNVGVGRLMAKEMLKVKDSGNFAVIKGDPGDPNATFLYNGMMEVLKANIDGGKIKIVGEASSDGWKPENAQKNMEQILTANDNNVDAVLSENDGMAGGVVAALQAQGLAGAVPVTGQDGDKAALNRVAQGTQLVSIWKDSRALGKLAAEAALMLADGKSMEDVPNVAKFKDGARKVEMNAVLLNPTPITKDNLNLVIDAGWVDAATVCAGVKAGSVAVCK